MAKAVSDSKGGKINFRVDKQANLHFVIGKASFDEKALAENYGAALDEVLRAKPSSSKAATSRRSSSPPPPTPVSRSTRRSPATSPRRKPTGSESAACDVLTWATRHWLHFRGCSVPVYQRHHGFCCSAASL